MEKKATAYWPAEGQRRQCYYYYTSDSSKLLLKVTAYWPAKGQGRYQTAANCWYLAWAVLAWNQHIKIMSRTKKLVFAGEVFKCLLLVLRCQYSKDQNWEQSLPLHHRLNWEQSFPLHHRLKKHLFLMMANFWPFSVVFFLHWLRVQIMLVLIWLYVLVKVAYIFKWKLNRIMAVEIKW